MAGLMKPLVAGGLLLMAISNKFGALLLTTGNKSELAVGYCTLYGDMCGGLAVISDVPKMMVYRLSKWINREREIIPSASITKLGERSGLTPFTSCLARKSSSALSINLVGSCTPFAAAAPAKSFRFNECRGERPTSKIGVSIRIERQ